MGETIILTQEDLDALMRDEHDQLEFMEKEFEFFDREKCYVGFTVIFQHMETEDYYYVEASEHINGWEFPGRSEEHPAFKIST